MNLPACSFYDYTADFDVCPSLPLCLILSFLNIRVLFPKKESYPLLFVLPSSVPPAAAPKSRWISADILRQHMELVLDGRRKAALIIVAYPKTFFFLSRGNLISLFFYNFSSGRLKIVRLFL